MSNESNEAGQPSGAPKIIVDSDWKEQVAKEKVITGESAASTSGATDEPEPVSPSDLAMDEKPKSDAKLAEPKPAESQPLPPPTFEVLISMLFTQAISSLGQIPNPIDGETSVNKPVAKHTIDMLDMLSTKTKGNLSDTESKMLSEALHMLRMAYVNARG